MRLFLFEIDGYGLSGTDKADTILKVFVMAPHIEGALAEWRTSMHLPEWREPLTVKMHWNHAFCDFNSFGIGLREIMLFQSRAGEAS